MPGGVAGARLTAVPYADQLEGHRRFDAGPFFTWLHSTSITQLGNAARRLDAGLEAACLAPAPCFPVPRTEAFTPSFRTLEAFASARFPLTIEFVNAERAYSPWVR
jgi:hypothetical protein